MENQFKITWVVAVTLMLSVKVSGQWAGASGPDISTSKVQEVKKNAENGLIYFGLEYGGFSKNYLNYKDYRNTPGDLGNVTSVNYGEITGAGFIIGKLVHTLWKPLYVGFELSGAYYSQKVTYDWNNGSSVNKGWIGDMNFTQIGGAIPIRLRFVNNDQLNIYFQGNIGAAQINVNDNHEKSLMFGDEFHIYGSGSLGVKLAPLFIEMGVNIDNNIFLPKSFLRVGVNW